MTISSDTQQAKSEASASTDLGTQSKKATEELPTGPLATLGKLSASALLMIGVIYVMGYVIVNGYQTKYMNYSANALQLKHLAAGLLYAVLTMFQVVVVAFFLLSGVIDVKFPAAGEEEKEKPERKAWERSWDRVKYIGNYSWVIAKSFFFAYFLTALFFQFVGMSLPPTRLGLLAIVKGILPWVGINLLMSIIIVKGLYSAGSKNFDIALREATKAEEGNSEQEGPVPVSSSQGNPEPASSENTSDENSPVSTVEVQRLRRIFIAAQTKPLLVTLASFVLLLFSLVFFQGLYGRLKPDYGGGALYRVALHMKPSNSLSAYVKDNIRSNDSWLLLVDKDGTFVYVLRVDKNGNKQLLEIAAGDVEAVEVLADPPISPADARFFIQ